VGVDELKFTSGWHPTSITPGHSVLQLSNLQLQGAQLDPSGGHLRPVDKNSPTMAPLPVLRVGWDTLVCVE